MNPIYTQWLHDFLKAWTPWATLFTVLWRVYSALKGRVTEWADKLLDNHLAHLQASMDRLEDSTNKSLDVQNQQLDLLARIAEK